MGNKIGRKRQVVDEQHTRLQGLYHHQGIDPKKLRKLILESKLAPCYPGEDEFSLDREECPICFLHYPSLNQSKCCTKGICTECYLQMKPLHSARPTKCPFCKTSNYSTEYHGVKTREEKGMEQIEEQKFIEAQIRIHQQELHDEAEKMKKRHNINSSMVTPLEVEYIDVYSTPHSVQYAAQGSEFPSAQPSLSSLATTRPSNSREDDFDLDLEEIMLMEAIWLSIKDEGTLEIPGCGGSILPQTSPSGCYNFNPATPSEVSASPDSSIAVSPNIRRATREEGECSVDQRSPMAAAAGTGSAPLMVPDGVDTATGRLPESFEGQMVLAMTVSLAEARGMATA